MEFVPAPAGAPASSQDEIARRAGLPIHPPKIELYDLAEHVNVDSKGHRRPVDEYRVTPFGLYCARPMVDHPRAAYVESWLLPRLGLRVTDWWWHPGSARDQDFYLDVLDVTTSATQWRSTDLYLDIVVRQRHSATVLDMDEFVLATRCGALEAEVAERALATTCATVDALGRYDYDLPAWLRDQGIILTWHKQGKGDYVRR